MDMLFDVKFVHENILWKHRSAVNWQQHLFKATLLYLSANKVNVIFNNSNYFTNKVTL